ncbi:MAG: hypothetical protein J6K22_10985 [Spirochaetaceae bacterium]|nr:hypothetical protein [Spirochaetaceae bacterium]
MKKNIFFILFCLISMFITGCDRFIYIDSVLYSIDKNEYAKNEILTISVDGSLYADEFEDLYSGITFSKSVEFLSLEGNLELSSSSENSFSFISKKERYPDVFAKITFKLNDVGEYILSIRGEALTASGNGIGIGKIDEIIEFTVTE